MYLCSVKTYMKMKVEPTLQSLVDMGYLSQTNLNKRAMGYIKSEHFEQLLTEVLDKK